MTSSCGILLRRCTALQPKAFCAMSSMLKYHYEATAIAFYPAEVAGTPDAAIDENFWRWLSWRGWDLLEFLILYSNLIPISLFVDFFSFLFRSIQKLFIFSRSHNFRLIFSGT